ncbi:MAG TPA: type II toxin-antitoxin system prevent-host-death family antitoxin [Iamia sp.]|jgi:prevent-host-death family protein|nr:type II toxin-antitoxin system prevent-host-death family antitoxin [Iamia sp.]
MTDISATEAARSFSRLLDSVEHDGASYTVVRHGRAVAHLAPVPSGSGAAVKELLRGHRPDPAWRRELDELRATLDVEDRD